VDYILAKTFLTICDLNTFGAAADGLKLILDAFKAKRNPNFSPKLLTKGGLLKAQLIAKNL